MTQTTTATTKVTGMSTNTSYMSRYLLLCFLVLVTTLCLLLYYNESNSKPRYSTFYSTQLYKKLKINYQIVKQQTNNSYQNKQSLQNNTKSTTTFKSSTKSTTTITETDIHVQNPINKLRLTAKKLTTWCSVSSSTHPKLLIIVCSRPSDLSLRNSIRNTWGKLIRENYSPLMRVAFLIGKMSDNNLLQNVLSESKKNNDMFIDESFIDTYENLSEKTLAAFSLLTTQCQNADYLLKVDDDTVINVKNLATMVQREYRIYPNIRKAIVGHLQVNAVPFRDQSSKWYVSVDDYPGSSYPTFASGPGYFITKSAIKPILILAKKQSKHLHLEDVYITGILAEKAQVPRIYDEGFYNLQLAANCDFKQHKISAHYYNTAEMMQTFWNTITSLTC